MLKNAQKYKMLKCCEKQMERKFKPEFFSFIYHALMEKLLASTQELAIVNDELILDERVLDFWGDFFEQVVGIDRNKVLEKTYQRLSRVMTPEMKLSDPVVRNILFHAELCNLSGGGQELGFDDIYEPASTN